ncbi:hypothetical protein SK128_017634 [Halocaridina rubra]|uniref:PH domain-containing protein n=1 Tax=Halocaridina rubra TaxID=373956 RepID=A0AAN8X0P3_HALRR
MSAAMHLRDDEEPLLPPKQTFIRQNPMRMSMRRPGAGSHGSRLVHKGFQEPLSPLIIPNKPNHFKNSENHLGKIYEGICEEHVRRPSNESADNDYLPPISLATVKTANPTSFRSNHDISLGHERNDISSHSSRPPQSPRTPTTAVQHPHPLKPHFHEPSIFFPNTKCDTNFTANNQTGKESKQVLKNFTPIHLDNVYINDINHSSITSPLRPPPSPRTPTPIHQSPHALKPHFYPPSLFSANTASITNSTIVPQIEQENKPEALSRECMHNGTDTANINEPRSPTKFSSFRASSFELPHRKKTQPVKQEIGRQIPNANQQQDSKKKFVSLFKRCSSPSLFRSAISVEESSHYEEPKQSSPKTYVRHQAPSSPAPTSFKRFGSFPLQRKQANSIGSNHSNWSSDDSDHKTLSKPTLTFKRPSTPEIFISDTSNFLSRDVRPHFKENVRLQEDANCFALLPTTRPLTSLSEDVISDPNTTRIPIQLEPKYDRTRIRRKTTQTVCTTTAMAVSSNIEKSLGLESAIVMQRAQSLPTARRKELTANNPFISNRKADNVKEEQEVRSTSLVTAPTKNEATGSALQYTPESSAEYPSTSSSTYSTSSETQESEVERLSGITRSLETCVANNTEPSLKFLRDNRVSNSSEECPKLSRDISRRSSVSSVASGSDIYPWIDITFQDYKVSAQDIESNADHIAFFLHNDNEYLSCLAKMLEDFERMKYKTPSHIRQHFDVAYKQLNLIYHFQTVFHAAAEEAGTNLSLLADVFKDDQFQCYSNYMIITPMIQKSVHRYSEHMQENYPSLKKDYLQPSLRLNFYIKILESLKKGTGEFEKIKLDDAISYLTSLQCLANTEMTITSVVNSPVDMRLCGKMKMSGELYCYGGGPLQKRKYHAIMFENLLMITSLKLPFLKYKIHYRLEQLDFVKAVDNDENEFQLKVHTEGKGNTAQFRFKAQLSSQRDKWVEDLQSVISLTMPQNSGDIPKSIMNSRLKSQMLPLSLYIALPQLLTVMTQKKSNLPSSQPSELYNEVICREKTYIRQLASYLNPEVLNPSDSLTSIFEKLYHLHNKKFLPSLLQSSEKNLQDTLSTLLDHMSLFQLYAEYFVVRCQVHSELERTKEASLYISPLQHFIFYMNWLKQVSLDQKFKDMVLEALHRLEELVLSAQVRLLSESIVQRKIDFYRSGNLLRADSLEVKTRQKGIHEGYYHVLLFEKILILTKPKPPFYEYVWDIWLNEVNLGPPSNSERGFKLEVRKGRGKEAVTFEFRAFTAETQQVWVRIIQHELMQQAEDIRKRTITYQLYD